MIWLALVGLTVVTDSLRIFIDNYVSDVLFKKNGSPSQKFFYGFAYVITAIIMLVVLQVDFATADWLAFGLIFLCGVVSAFSGIPYYKALELDDSTNFGIFMQLAPVLYLVAGWFLLGEEFSPLQLVAFAVILSAPMLIVSTTRKRSRKIKLHAVFYTLIYILIAISGNILFVKVSGDGANLWTLMPFFFMGKGITNVGIVLAYPKWRKRFIHVTKASHYKLLGILGFNHLLGITADFAYRASLVLAPAVAIASAVSDTVEPIVIFFMGLLLTLIWPQFGREKLGRKVVVVHLLATLLVVIGIVILQFA